MPKLQDEDTEVIEEAFHLLRTRGDSVWPGWSDVWVPLIYKKKNIEYKKYLLPYGLYNIGKGFGGMDILTLKGK